MMMIDFNIIPLAILIIGFFNFIYIFIMKDLEPCPPKPYKGISQHPYKGNGQYPYMDIHHYLYMGIKSRKQ